MFWCERHDIKNVEFEEITNAKTWHETVTLYKIIDKKSGDDIAYFYTDFIPRKGKYSHAAAFTLRPGKLDTDGKLRFKKYVPSKQGGKKKWLKKYF